MNYFKIKVKTVVIKGIVNAVGVFVVCLKMKLKEN